MGRKVSSFWCSRKYTRKPKTVQVYAATSRDSNATALSGVMALKHDDSTFSPATHATAVIGSGTMGSRIALMLASSGGEVRLYDLNADQLEAARRYIEVELPRVVAGRPGALPGRLVLSRTVQAAVADTWMVVEAIQPTSDQPPKRFEHYELVTGDDGKPVELGRGAMGVTYKAFDVDGPEKSVDESR
jgi:hypothetical protein